MSYLFETPLKTGKIRNNVYYHKFGNGTININGSKFCGYSIKDAVKIWRKRNPIN